MTQTRERPRCLFCFIEGDVPKLTKEHLMSRPVAKAFGINRESQILRTSLEADDYRFYALNGLSQPVVCAPCNNGWMNQLEDRMAEVAQWVSAGTEPLGVERDLTVRAWTLKTHLILCYLEGKAHLCETDDSAVIPNYTRARELFEWNEDALRRIAVGLTRPNVPDKFNYSFGTPTILPVGPDYPNSRSATASIITLGPLQLWIAVPLLESAVVSGPSDVIGSGIHVRGIDLKPRPPLVHLDEIIVTHSDKM